MTFKHQNTQKFYKNFKKQFFIFNIIFFSILGNSFGQSITWQRTYDGRDHVSDGGFDVCKADGGNIYVCGYTTVLPNIENIYLMKLSPLGDTIWTRTMNLGSNIGKFARAIVSSGDNGCVLTGDAGFAFSLKFNSNGDVIWNKNYGGFFKQCFNIIKTSDGGYISCGRDAEGTNEGAYLLKIDSMGNIQWQKTYYAGYWKTFYSVIEAHANDGYIIAGFRYNSEQDSIKSVLLRINAVGDSLWEKQYSQSELGIVYSIKKLDAGYLIGGNNYTPQTGRKNFISKIDENGNVSYLRILPNNNLSEYFGEIDVINPNKYVIAASQDSIVSYNAHLILTDSLGNILAEKIYRSSDFIDIRSVQPLNNGDIAFTGQVDFDPVHTREDIYVLRTDSLLNSPPPIGINNANTQIPLNIKLFQNYPNPFNPTTKFKFDIPVSSRVTIKIYDILGKQLFSIYEFKSAGSYEVSFDGSDLASGMYFYSLESSDPSTGSGRGFKDTKKMALIK